MKRFMMFFLTILMLVLLVACDEGGGTTSVCQHRDADDNSLCDKCSESYTDGVDVTPEHTHAWSAWSVTTPATCQAKGEETRTCACGEDETRDMAIDPDAHTFGEWIETTAPTCQAKGVETRTCACGEDETRDVAINPDAHTFGEWIETTAPTCQAKGVETRTCACGEDETRDVAIDPDAHTFGEWIETTAPTCQAKGEETRTCACGESETRDVNKDMNNHVAWGNWQITTTPTCQAKGEETRTCACGESETRDVNKDMDNHVAWGSWQITTTPTCQAKGEETRTCACGHSETRDSEKDMENHVAWGTWGVTTPATCQAKGEETRTCACGHSETREISIDADAHTFDRKIADQKYIKSQATYTAPAYYYFSCACGAKGSESFAHGDSLSRPEISSIALSKESISFEVGESETLNVIYYPEDSGNQTVTWVVSDPSIAMVTNGVVVGIKEGDTTVIAVTGNGKTATCRIHVLPRTYVAESVQLSKSTLELPIGYSHTLTATVLPDYTTNKSVIWSSSDPSVAKVEDGVVIAVSRGTAIITATTACGKTASCTVATLFIPLTDILINEQLIYLDSGTTTSIQITTVPSNATVTELIWESSSTGVATVVNGVISGVKDGIVVITVKSVDGAITKRFNVVVENSQAHTYTKVGNGYALAALGQIAETVIIPDTYKGLPITRINSGVFGVDCFVIKKLHIGSNVTAIPDGALLYCENLQELVIPSVDNSVDALFGSVQVEYTGTTEEFYPDKMVGGAYSDDSYIYNVPAPNTDWLLFVKDGNLYVEGRRLSYNQEILRSDVISWQSDKFGREYCQVPKKVRVTAYYTPIGLTVTRKSAVALSVDTVCASAVQSLKAVVNGVALDVSLADLLSLSDLEKLTVAGTHEITVFYGGYTATLTLNIMAEHSPATEWQSDGTYHWHACTRTGCEAHVNEAGHTYGEWHETLAPTCVAEGSRHKQCTTCSYKVTEAISIDENAHAPATKWTSDGESHWHACTRTGCSAHVNEVGHTYGEWHETLAPTCVAEGNRYKQCTTCSYKMIEAIPVDEDAHAPATQWTSDGESHWHACTRTGCSAHVNEVGHTYGEWHETLAPTCVAEGSRYKQCTTCSYKVTEAIPIDENAHAYGVWQTMLAPTCMTEGSHYKQCTACSHKVTEVIPVKADAHSPATAWTTDEACHWKICTNTGCNAHLNQTTHTYGTWKITLAPTCMKEGSHFKQCTACSYRVTEVIPIDSDMHAPASAWISDGATHWHECTRAGCEGKANESAHTYRAWQTTLTPTCMTEGSHYKQCTACSYKVTEVIPIDPDMHAPASAWISDGATHWHECARVGCEGQANEAAHTYGAWQTTLTPTCIAEGSHYKQCTTCSYKVTEAIPIDEDAHDFTAQVQTSTYLKSAANCQGPAEYYYKCTLCDDHGTNTYQIGTKTSHALNENLVCTMCSNTYIYFGEYPQTIKADDITVTEIQDSRGYYLGSDNAYYAKVTADPFQGGYTFSDGSTVTDGAVYYFKVEPIRWRILSQSNDTALILCDSIIANKAFDAGSGYNNNYAESDIRAWLNAEFYNTAFTALEQELILTTTVDNSVASTWCSSNPYACENTDDKIFLLSTAELFSSEYGYFSRCSRSMQPSDYSRATGVITNTNTNSSYYGDGDWWLRSPHPSYSYGAYLAGNNMAGGSTVYRTYGGVVPALQIRL